VRIATTTASELRAPGRRLDASFHASTGVRALHHINRWVVHAQPLHANNILDVNLNNARRIDLLAAVCRKGGIFIPARFKRVYVTEAEHGAPYLTGSSVMQANPLEGAKRLSYRYTTNMARLALDDRMTLITCSGTIGNSVYVNANFAGAVASPDLLRIVADQDSILPGYLFAFLSSPLGKSLIEQKTYGAVVPHIEAHHVTDLPIPRLEPQIEQRIHDLIEKAAQLRVDALSKEHYAKSSATERLGIDIDKVFQHSRYVLVSSSNIISRFEAVYHSVGQKVNGLFKDTNIPLVKIGDMVRDAFYLGKLHRVFVESSQEGVPLISIADALKAKLTAEKFISRKRSRNVEQAKLNRGWLLVSRIGTPGQITFVRREMEGMVGTDNIVRLVPDERTVLPGYLYCVLSSNIGQSLLRAAAHGAVQYALPPEYIKQIRIPLLPIDLQQSINRDIDEYGELLTQASEAEDTAQSILAEALDLNT
jgi:type I restriction enzyme, S subunit